MSKYNLRHGEVSDIARQFNLSRQMVSRIIKGKTPKKTTLTQQVLAELRRRSKINSRYDQQERKFQKGSAQ